VTRRELLAGLGPPVCLLEQPARLAGDIGQLRNAEIQELDVLVAGDEDVGHLQVAVDDAALVRRGESLGHLCGPLQRSGKGYGSSGEPLLKSLAPQKLCHQIRLPILEADVIEGDDVGVADGAGQPRLAFEPLARRAVVSDRFGHHLDGHIPAQTGVPGTVDFRHPAGADQPHHLIWPEKGTGSQIHRGKTQPRGIWLASESPLEPRAEHPVNTVDRPGALVHGTECLEELPPVQRPRRGRGDGARQGCARAPGAGARLR